MQDNNQRALLEIAHYMAVSDGNISREEERLIRELPSRLGLGIVDNPDAGVTPSPTRSVHDLVAALPTHGDRCLAARIACLVAGVSRNPDDSEDINSDERRAYRELLADLNLSEDELNEIEWSAQQELKQGRPLIRMIMDSIFGTGSWPDPSLLPPEIPYM